MADAAPVDDEAKAARRREIERSVAAARETQASAERAAKDALDKPERGARNLTKQQVVEKLDNVPVFTIVEEASGALVGVADESGETCCRWYADVNEVQSALVLTQHLNPDLPLSLGVTPLGTAFALTSGWKTTSSAHPLKLQASKAVVTAVAKELGAAPDGAFPLFGCDELQSARLLPLFLSKDDLHATWRAMGRSADAMPTELQVSSLHTIGASARTRRTGSSLLLPARAALLLTMVCCCGAPPVQKMLTDDSMDWSTLMLVASEGATALAHKIQTRPKKPAGPDDEPPPLE